MKAVCVVKDLALIGDLTSITELSFNSPSLYMGLALIQENVVFGGVIGTCVFCLDKTEKKRKRNF